MIEQVTEETKTESTSNTLAISPKKKKSGSLSSFENRHFGEMGLTTQLGSNWEQWICYCHLQAGHPDCLPDSELRSVPPLSPE